MKKFISINILIISFLALYAAAQVFIPFGYWGSKIKLAVTPSTAQYIQAGDPIAFSAVGETGSYIWSITGAALADGATITTPGVTSDYTGRLTPYTSDIVTVASVTSLDVSVTTFVPLAISPTTRTIPINASHDFSVSNGLCVISPPTACTDATATWTVTSGGASGSVNATGVFTATAVPGAAVLEVSDVISNTSIANITVTNTLAIAPTSLKIGVFSTNLFTATLGTLPYVYTVSAGTGTIGCQSTLTGTHNATTTTINVTDTTGCPPVGVIKIATEDVCYTATTGTTFTGGTRGCNATVAAAYTAGQTYNANQAVYTAPGLIGAATVKVTDAGATSADASVAIVRPVDVKVGAYFACALYDEGSLKCWGTNGNGQLGIGSTTTIGDSSLEVGGANAFTNLGTGRTVSQFALGNAHACAILDNNNLKCWGNGGSGRTGYGDAISRGDGANEMGDSLPVVDLGTGRYAVEVALGASHSCARLDNGSVKCWGNGTSGRLGSNGTANIGDLPNQMGDNLIAVNLGVGRTATKIVAGLDYACALLDDGNVKCWGENQRGQLGQDDTTDRGNATNPMSGVNNIVIGGTATDIISLYETVCIKRNDNSMICWGRNNRGQVGKGATAGANANIGDAAGEMAAIAAINFGAGFGTLSKMFGMGQSACAQDTLNVTKCWGYGNFGAQLNAATTNVTAPGAVMNFGTGLILFKLYSYFDTACALFTNDRIKCFGRARTGTAGVVNGVLLNGSVESSLGNAAGEVGDLLLYTNH